MKRPAVYRLRSGSGELLYIGYSSRVFVRIGQHSTDKSWWDEVDHSTIDIRYFDTQAEALQAEAAAIRSESPKYNRSMNPAYSTSIREQSRSRYSHLSTQELKALCEQWWCEDEEEDRYFAENGFYSWSPRGVALAVKRV